MLLSLLLLFFNYTDCLGLNNFNLAKMKTKDKEQQGGERLTGLRRCDQGLDTQWVGTQTARAVLAVETEV